MRREIIALIIQEGGRFCSELIRNRHRKQAVVEYPPTTVLEEPFETAVKEEEKAGEITSEKLKAISIEAGCVPCSLGHLGTCSGLLNEAMRFARSDGIESNEVIDRVTHCLQELNSLEREDLSPEMIINLPPWEKELAIEALETSRATRHHLEAITTVNELEKAAANTQTANTKISRKWFKRKLSKMTPEEKTKIATKAIEKLGEEE